jgi:predicted dehydrogenase
MRIGFVGGNGHHYLRGFIKSPPDKDVVVAACGDGYDDAAAERWSKSHACQWYDSFDVLCQDFKPDVISVGAVYGKNGEWVARALERHVPVVSDKPIASTWKQLDRIHQLIDETKLNVITEFDMRCRAEFRAARKAVLDGKIGKVLLATAQKSYRFGMRPQWYSNRDLYGGTLLWIASHAIDAVRYVSGLHLTHVTGHQGNLSHPELGSFEDHLAVLYKAEKNASAVVHADFSRAKEAATHGDDRIRVAGSEGVVELRDARCYLTTNASPIADITETVKPLKPHEAMWDAVQGNSCDVFSTQHSLETAALLLRSRDACDKSDWMEI